MPLDLPTVQRIVQQTNKVDPQKLTKAVETAQHLEASLEEVLIGRRLITPDDLGKLLAQAQKVSYINLKSVDIPKAILQLVPEEFAVNQHVVPFHLENNVLSLAMEEPTNLEAIEFVKKHTGYSIKPVYANKSNIQFALRLYKGTLKEEFAELVEKSVASTTEVKRPIAELAKDVSIIKAVNTLLEFATVEDASDIHIEPLSDNIIIRYRIDGVLHDVLTLPLEIHPALVARIKILANLKLDETRLPQDGRMKYVNEAGEKVSLRVSILPSVEGEKVVLRILEEILQHFSLSGLGLYPDKEKKVLNSIKKPNGMILVTGPTGSGKTTTLYTILGILNTVSVNISTVEDPVENRIRRVNQTQVNSQAGYVFATGLRSLLRQDPDIIMVGEIRDQETAKIAVNAAMTGHLVLSTLHTNDAPGAIPRMIDLGLEPFLLASTLEMVVAQRLVRKICSDCRMEYQPKKDWQQALSQFVQDKNRLAAIQKILPQRFIKGNGCSHCHYSGYRGRLGIFEIMIATEEIRSLIASQAPVDKIRVQAFQQGMTTMLTDGIKKVADGLTTMEEVFRVSLE